MCYNLAPVLIPRQTTSTLDISELQKWITDNVDHSEGVAVRAVVAEAVAVAAEIRVRTTEINKNESPARPSWTWPSSWTKPSLSNSMEEGKVSLTFTLVFRGVVQFVDSFRSRGNFEGL